MELTDISNQLRAISRKILHSEFRISPDSPEMVRKRPDYTPIGLGIRSKRVKNRAKTSQDCLSFLLSDAHRFKNSPSFANASRCAVK